MFRDPGKDDPEANIAPSGRMRDALTDGASPEDAG